MPKQRLRALNYFFAVVLSLSGSIAQGQGKSSDTKSLDEVSIIGNTELPNVSFNLPWKLPSIAKRAEQKPVKELKGMLEPIEPRRHQQQVFFSQYLELELPGHSKN